MNDLNNIKTVEDNIKAAAFKSGRLPEEIELVAVSKTIAADRIKNLFDNGYHSFGENYVQEFTKKQEGIPQINWHFIGQLQTNKVKYIVNKIYMLHSLDRYSLAQEISKRYAATGETIKALIQVNIGKEEQKGGIAPESLIEFLDKVMELKSIEICGIMCIHPFKEPEECRRYFVEMYNLFQNAKDRGYPINNLSMGMSNDYVQAIEEGATIVRVGSAIFGHRIYYR
ncbi:MAG: YggS family pyridoxal phosphate-dependent enzyme [Clostridia bacterium]|nr:YggS family pyridoxal phosphate-dependent enzyme [Clostridia bacterium]